jgi:glutamate N-acetyltransferase/amino-acid N-acetyltransferase
VLPVAGEDTQPGPAGFLTYTLDAGIADDGRHDLAVAVSGTPAASSAVFTRSRFAGPSVALSRPVTGARGVLVASRNANVATGAVGAADARELRELAAEATGVEPERMLLASTGVIGRRYPMARVRRRLAGTWPAPGSWLDFATAIMTTDTTPKLVFARVGAASIVGVAKGVGMIEPNLATMLAFFFTDAGVAAEVLDRVFREVVDDTFNALSIDTDTSTSDTAAVLANGLAGPVPVGEFQQALYGVALDLVTRIARDGEGASKLLTVQVVGARDREQARRVAKSVVNSPLVKTMAHGADPNWGRVVMAVGKCEDELDIDPARVRVRLCGVPVYPDLRTEPELDQLRALMAADTVPILVELGIASGQFTAYGCDLSAGYVELNSSYTT